MKKLIKRIKILDITYVTMLFSFLVGYFEFIYILLLTIIIHELGHSIMALLLKKEDIKIKIYPLGGMTFYNDYNYKKLHEFLILIAGPLIQLILFLLIYYLNKLSLVNNNTFNIFYRINIILYSLNLLPIYPLDGGRLINLFFSLISNKHKTISIYISLFTILALLIYTFLHHLKLIYIITIVLISKDLIKEINTL